MGFKEKVRLCFHYPSQINEKYSWIVAFFGRIGFFTKAFMYSLIGYLICDGVIYNKKQNSSPQGVFDFIGAYSIILVYIAFGGILVYAAWRIWEGLFGQGYNIHMSPKKNFFRYRLSPIVSGGVYIAYSAYIIEVLADPHSLPAKGNSENQSSGSCFPECWRNSGIGMFGLAILAFAMLCGCISQLVTAITQNFKDDFDLEKLRNNVVIKYILIMTGIIGFLARALLFGLVSVFFILLLSGKEVDLDPSLSTIGQALYAFQNITAGFFILFITGVGLNVYGVFAVLNIYYRVFPTVNNRIILNRIEGEI